MENANTELDVNLQLLFLFFLLQASFNSLYWFYINSYVNEQMTMFCLFRCGCNV